jgi:uncharacterized RDD family membrane protein YckC
MDGARRASAGLRRGVTGPAALDVAGAGCWDRAWVRASGVDALDNTTDVETPERIRFRHHVAGPVRRGLAYLLDTAIRGVVLALTALLISGAGALDSDKAKAKASWGLGLLVLFVMEWGWNVLFETFWRGRTIGKRALGLQVLRTGGYPVGFIDSVLRNLLRAADFLPVGYVLGLLVMVGDRRFRRLGDRIAGTMVVIETKSVVAQPIVLSPPASPDELGTLPHRPPLRADEWEAIELFLRRPHLSNARRVELAEIVAQPLSRRMGIKHGDPVRFLGLLHQRGLGARRPATVPLEPRA